MANAIHVVTDSDDGELWVPEGAESSPPELAPLNPWRSSTMLRCHREVGAPGGLQIATNILPAQVAALAPAHVLY